ncbi:MAG: electron transfer flavoprotein subunit alpha/FixB family protein [Victivallales bacterium]|nr:electron transfer flavoprotein subunit alpha/FixB family protein [Victivallales bacterium]
MKEAFSGIWIIAGQRDGELLRISFELIARGLELARKRNTSLTAVVFGAGMTNKELYRLIRCGADRVIVADFPELDKFDLELHAACLTALINEYKPEVVLAGATTTGRSLAPYAAMNVHAGLTADCTGLDIDPESGLLIQTRPAAGGNIMASIKSPSCRPQMATLRPHSCLPAEPLKGRGESSGVILRMKQLPPSPEGRNTVKHIGFCPLSEDFGIQDAEKVVVVGRGIKKADNLKLVFDFAKRIGAAVGATREVVDRGWMSYPHQIGLSGKTISPRLYMAFGVSGSIQHLAGMRTAETVVAVNTDPEAQIFSIADFGITGSLFDVIPALIGEINAGNATWIK